MNNLQRDVGKREPLRPNKNKPLIAVSPSEGQPERRPMGVGESEGCVGCAGQRTDQEGSSPSGARMRGAISKDGGNASSAREEEGMETPKRARRRKPATAKVNLEPPQTELWRAGCLPRGGIRRACGEVPGRSREEPSS